LTSPRRASLSVDEPAGAISAVVEPARGERRGGRARKGRAPWLTSSRGAGVVVDSPPGRAWWLTSRRGRTSQLAGPRETTVAVGEPAKASVAIYEPARGREPRLTIPRGASTAVDEPALAIVSVDEAAKGDRRRRRAREERASQLTSPLGRPSPSSSSRRANAVVDEPVRVSVGVGEPARSERRG